MDTTIDGCWHCNPGASMLYHTNRASQQVPVFGVCVLFYISAFLLSQGATGTYYSSPYWFFLALAYFGLLEPASSRIQQTSCVLLRQVGILPVGPAVHAATYPPAHRRRPDKYGRLVQYHLEAALVREGVGYVPIVYAWDVEVQTPNFRTTQENSGEVVFQTVTTTDILATWEFWYALPIHKEKDIVFFTRFLAGSRRPLVAGH